MGSCSPWILLAVGLLVAGEVEGVSRDPASIECNHRSVSFWIEGLRDADPKVRFAAAEVFHSSSRTSCEVAKMPSHTLEPANC